MNALRFDGQVALVTGAGSGLGLRYAIDLARRGAHVVANDMARSALAEVCAAEPIDGAGTIVAEVADIAVETQARAAVARTIDRFGRLDILINNAGIARPLRAQDTRSEDLRTVLDTHIFGAFWLVSEALPHMRRAGYGRIVNTGSGLGAFGAAKNFSYVVAKAAVFGMTKAVAQDNADVDIKANSISPIAVTGMAKGFDRIDPRLTDEKMSVSHVSPAVLVLSHRDCPVNGEMISAAGGRVARIFTATAPGFASADLTPEQLLEHWRKVMDPARWRAFTTSRDQYDFIP